MSVRTHKRGPRAAEAPNGAAVGQGAPGRPRVPRAEREPQMVEAATRVFGRRGFADASMDEIAAAAGVSKPMLYSYFESKEGLFQACVGAAAERLREAVQAAASESGLAPDERLWNGLLAVFDFIEGQRGLWRVMLPGYGETVPPRIGAEAVADRDAMSELLSEILIDAALSEGLSPQAAAQAAPMGYALTAAVLAMTRWWLEHPEEPKEVQALRVMNLVWAGFGDLLAGRMWLPPE